MQLLVENHSVGDELPYLLVGVFLVIGGISSATNFRGRTSAGIKSSSEFWQAALSRIRRSDSVRPASRTEFRLATMRVIGVIVALGGVIQIVIFFHNL